MKLRRALTPFLCGILRYPGGPGLTFESDCRLWSYEFPMTSTKEEKNARHSLMQLWTCLYYEYGLPEGFMAFLTAKVRPAVVYVARENEIGRSGIIIDSKGTILTRANNAWRLDARTKINVSLPDGRNVPGTILKVAKGHDIALLKTQSESSLPIAKIGYLSFYNHVGELISIEHPLRRGPYSRSSSQVKVDKEVICGGPIVNIDGEVVAVSTHINIDYEINEKTWYVTIEAMRIEEAFRKLGYKKNESLELMTDEDG